MEIKPGVEWGDAGCESGGMGWNARWGRGTRLRVQAEDRKDCAHMEVKMQVRTLEIRQLFLLQQSTHKTSGGELPYQVAKGT
jgi:hypothetical protein